MNCAYNTYKETCSICGHPEYCPEYGNRIAAKAPVSHSEPIPEPKRGNPRVRFLGLLACLLGAKV
jgi:hypothetical protein